MPKRNIVWIVLVAVVAVLLWKAPESSIRRDALYNKFGPLLDVRLQVVKYYVEEVNDDDLLRGAIEGMLNGLDPYSTYFTEAEYQEFQKRTQGEFPGIGVHLANPPGLDLVVISPMEGTPAFRAGLRAGDRITHVDGVKTAGRVLDECVRMISGPAGTPVTLTVQRPGLERPFDLTITRSVVNVPSVRGWARTADWKWDYLIDPKDRIGYVRLISFEGKTAEQLHEILTDLLARQQMRGLVLDVRDNPGGPLEGVVTIANRFLKEGKIVSTKSRNQPEVAYMATGRDTYPDVPLAILVNGGSASASEILAGSLRDHRRAVVVGEKTFGKGSVQEILAVENNNGKIKLTTAYYYLPNGECVHNRGIVPDRIVDMTPQERTARLESWMAVYSGGNVPLPSAPASAPPDEINRPGTRPAPTRPVASAPAYAPQGLTSTPAPAPPTDAATTRFEIAIDPQLREAIQIVRESLRPRADGTAPAASAPRSAASSPGSP